MTNRVLVAGGTGALGQVVVDQLLASGADVRVLSRGRRRHRQSDVAHVRGDLRTGAGLDAAVSGVATIVQCAEHVHHLVAAANLFGQRRRAQQQPPCDDAELVTRTS
jgi:nucleoside-diphosphate-sugar epimerase